VMRMCAVLTLSCPYPLFEGLKNTLVDFGASIDDTSFGARVEVRFAVPAGKEEEIAALITERSSGAVVCKAVTEEFRALPESDT
jgi:putative IMPACT (imprinted ancient) family translation regulator